MISSRFLFNKNHLSKEWDVFGCFAVPDFEPNELFPMDPSGTKKYTEEDEDGSAGAAAAAATAAAKVTIGKKFKVQILRVTSPALGSDELNLDQSGASIKILPELELVM